MTTSLSRLSSARTLLAHLIEAPDLVQTLRELPPHTFSALVRHIGVEDAGEIIALGTTAQLVTAFDEDLFVNARAGERETFQSARFVTWLEVLLEGGEDVAATRFTELSEDFVVQALSSIVLVLDHDALLARMAEGGAEARAADKAIESCLSEEIDGYLLISLIHDGWDAALALILALDRDHRAFLVRVLDRCADLASGYVEDLEGLTTALCATDSLAEDVEGEREDRRSKLGYVEPRMARSFLSLARTPVEGSAATADRDPVTRAYFRELEPAPVAVRSPLAASGARLGRALEDVSAAAVPRLHGAGDESSRADQAPIMTAMRLLAEQEPLVCGERLESLAYLTNVLLVGTDGGNGRRTPAEAAEAALATVGLGAELEAREKLRTRRRLTPSELLDVLRVCRPDVLFRKASSALVAHANVAGAAGFLRSSRDIDGAVHRILRRGTRKR